MNNKVQSSLSPYSLVGLSTCFMFLSAQAAEYCLRTGKKDGTQANTCRLLLDASRVAGLEGRSALQGPHQRIGRVQQRVPREAGGIPSTELQARARMPVSGARYYGP